MATTPDALIKLAECLEKAPAGQATYMIRQAADLLWDYGADPRRFSHHLENQGYVEAATMLIPEGWRIAEIVQHYGDDAPWNVALSSAKFNPAAKSVQSHAATEGLARAAAALRAWAATGLALDEIRAKMPKRALPNPTYPIQVLPRTGKPDTDRHHEPFAFMAEERPA